MRPLVSVICVAFNNPQFVVDLVTTLQRQTYDKIEVIVVDNSRNEDLMKYLENRKRSARDPITRLTYVPNENTGYAGGNVRGITYSHGDFIFILNPDTTLQTDTIEILVNKFLKSSERVLVLVPKIMIKDTGIINSIGMKTMHVGENVYVNIGYLERDNGQYDCENKLEAFDGAAFMFKREMLSHTYLFDPRFFFGHETTDLAERLIKNGFEIRSCPRAVVNHNVRGTVTTEKVNNRMNVLLVRNLLIHTFKNRGWAIFLRTLWIGIFYRNVVWPIAMRNENWRLSFTYMKGIARFVLDIGRFM